MKQTKKPAPVTASPAKDLGANGAWAIHFKGMTADDVRRSFLNNLEYNIAKDRFTFTPNDQYLSLGLSIRDRLVERWILTQQKYHIENVKRVYYMSLEFLMGRLMSDNILNLGIEKECREAMQRLGLDLDQIEDQEPDAGLGNGGLGRLAACFLDSMATLELPAIGYGIRYEFGIFKQKIVGGEQRETPEEWLQFGNPWEIERPEYRLDIKYYGRVHHPNANDLRAPADWLDAETVMAIPFDIPIPGYQNNTVNTLRLWSARAASEFKLEYFNSGDYIRACEEKLSSENISKVLYPNDNNHSGRELRLRQQHFFTSASLKDIIRRYLKHNPSFDEFPNKVAIQLNDTHPSIAIAELMRRLVDKHGIPWNTAWDITRRTFAYTNHTLMPEALEKWPVSMFKHMLPRHLEIIYELNKDFLDEVGRRYPGDADRMRRMSFIEEGAEPQVRMAHLAIVGSHSVNGVSELHSRLLTTGLVRDFCEMFPDRFNNKTNGITPRRWLRKANPSLSELISEHIGAKWVRNLSELRKLIPLAEDAAFRKAWQKSKHLNKVRLVERLKAKDGIDIGANFMFDVQVKRIHEYKRQLLNALHCIALYNRIKSGNTSGMVPRVVLFGGKAAPGYYMAKMIIKFINCIGDVVNNDPACKDLLRVHFVPNYRVTMAEYLMPAADVSEQISTAGTEASGTGNMKFALNGAVTVGTLDGANIEIGEEVGDDNIFIFGLRSEEVDDLRRRGYNPWDYYRRSSELRGVMDLIVSGAFSAGDPNAFRPLHSSLLDGGDRYMVMADFDPYVQCQNRVAEAYRDREKWTRMSIMNVATMGKFSSDRTIQQYAEEIWGVKAVGVELDG
jgi:starch phosphorylase